MATDNLRLQFFMNMKCLQMFKNPSVRGVEAIITDLDSVQENFDTLYEKVSREHTLLKEEKILMDAAHINAQRAYIANKTDPLVKQAAFNADEARVNAYAVFDIRTPILLAQLDELNKFREEISNAFSQAYYSLCYAKTLALLANATTREEYISILKDSHLKFDVDDSSMFGFKLAKHNPRQDASDWHIASSALSASLALSC